MAALFETVTAPDRVEYFIFPIQTNGIIEHMLQEIQSELQSFVKSLTHDFIWHKDPFNVRQVSSTESENMLPHLHGITHYGENIEDEWFIVYLLLTFSERCKDVFVRIADADGDFLLIEAAENLPNWIKSENSNYNSYINEGLVRIMPGPFSTECASIRTLITGLRSNEKVSPVENAVTKTIQKRIQHFSHNMNELLHKSRVYLPAKVAALLDAKPGLIASAVTAYCERDPIDERLCQKMNHFPPNDMVLRLVTFTKFLYAFISHQKINMRRNRLLWNLPHPSQPDYKEHCLGYKITFGFEMLASKNNERSGDLSLNKKWIQYTKILKNKGYFKDLLEGSAEYVELEKKARIYFLDNVRMEDADSNSVLNMLQTVTYNYNKMKKEESGLPCSDDEKWMDMDENELNKILEERFGIKAIDATNSPAVLTSTLDKFLNRASDFEGVELEKPKFNDCLNNMDVDEDNEGNQISFDPEGFLPSVEKMIDLMALSHKDAECEEEGSDSESDYSEADDTDDESKKDPVMRSYMNLMDEELQKSALSGDFIPKTNMDTRSADIDVNLLTHMLKSYEEQFGGSGPAGNILHSIGLKLDTKKE